MLNCLAVGLGGFLGSVLRYLMGLIPLREGAVFPVKTLAVNVLGCLAIGCLAALGAKHSALSPRLLLFFKVGVCGGFTTFSTFALETSTLLKGGHGGLALLYVALSLLLGFAAIYAADTLLS